MGTRTTRITASDFLIPPEFESFRLAERSAGQIGGISVSLMESGGRVVMGHCYQQVPLRVLPPFHFAHEPAALLYLLNPTAGLMDGDGHLLELNVEAGARAVVTGQSANRVHPAVTGFATQQWHVKVAPGACLVVLPGPVIPYRGCRYYQRAKIELEKDAQLVWGDIWTPGRYARGDLSEHYQFERIVQELEIWSDGDLIYRDRFVWDGPWARAQTQWYLGGDGTTACAGLFVTGTAGPMKRKPLVTASRAELKLAHGDTLIRWCGPLQELIQDVVHSALLLAGSRNGDPQAPAWLLDRPNLGPNHWFSIDREKVT